MALFNLVGGLVTIEQIANGIIPPIPHPDNTVPPKVLEASELVAGIMYGLTGK